MKIYDRVLSRLGLVTKSMCDQICEQRNSELLSVVDIYKRQQRMFSKVQKIDLNKLKSWSKRVREVGRCDICGSNEKLTAHHLWDKSNHPTMMYQDENGVCLCEEHHNGFHKRYTAKSQVTPAMYEKYKIKTENEIYMKTRTSENA